MQSPRLVGHADIFASQACVKCRDSDNPFEILVALSKGILMRIRLACGVVGALVVAALSGAASAESYTLMPVSDRDGYSSASLNGPFTLRADGLGSLIIGSGWDNIAYQWHTAMEFDLSGVSGTVTSALLSFRAEIISNGPAAFRIHGYAGDGTVTAADLTVVNQLGGTYDTLPFGSNPRPKYNVTDFTNSLVSGSTRFAGFNFSGFAGGSGIAIRSSEPYVGAPTLEIVTIPEPALISGVLATLCIGRRRHR